MDFFTVYFNVDKKKSWWDVLYQGTNEKAPAWVVECALAPYVKQFRATKRFEIIPESDIVASEFDKESFLAELMEVTESEVATNPEAVIPLCRYADESTVNRIIQQIKMKCPTGADNLYFIEHYKQAANIASEALLLNDTEAAREYAKSTGRLTDYENIHK